MQTENGLTIHRVDREHGGFDIELRVPAEHDPKKEAFATVSRGVAGGWHSRKGNTTSPDVHHAITLVDGEYGRYRRKIRDGMNQRQAERERLNESFAKDWQEVVEHYGCATPADD